MKWRDVIAAAGGAALTAALLTLGVPQEGAAAVVALVVKLFGW